MTANTQPETIRTDDLNNDAGFDVPAAAGEFEFDGAGTEELVYLNGTSGDRNAVQVKKSAFRSTFEVRLCTDRADGGSWKANAEYSVLAEGFESLKAGTEFALAWCEAVEGDGNARDLNAEGPDADVPTVEERLGGESGAAQADREAFVEVLDDHVSVESVGEGGNDGDVMIWLREVSEDVVDGLADYAPEHGYECVGVEWTSNGRVMFFDPATDEPTPECGVTFETLDDAREVARPLNEALRGTASSHALKLVDEADEFGGGYHLRVTALNSSLPTEVMRVAVEHGVALDYAGKGRTTAARHEWVVEFEKE